MLPAATLALQLTWYPGIAGILVVAASVVVLCGSVWLLLATNTGFRLGFLVALTSLFGFMALLGAVWWLYGIGLVGDAPSWRSLEVIQSTDIDDLSGAATPEARDLAGWRALDLADPVVGEASAAADAVLTDPNLGGFEARGDYLAQRALQFGGEPRWLGLRRAPAFMVIQVQALIPVTVLEEEGEPCPEGHRCIVFGEPPPSPEVQPGAPVVSAVLLRDLGSVRLPPALITIGSLVIFLVLCNALHRRDQLAERQRAALPVPAEPVSRTPVPGGTGGSKSSA